MQLLFFTLQGLPLEPRDIDIATTKNSLVLIQNKLEEYIKVKMERRLSKINLRLGFKKYAYFLTLEINGIKVDAMSNFKIKNTPLKYKKEDIVFIDLKGLKVPCLSIKKTYSAYVLAENKEKVELIKPYL